MTGKLVIIVGEHPNEVTASYMGVEVAGRLKKEGHDVSLERVPFELTLVGRVLKGLPTDKPGGGYADPWLEQICLKYGENAWRITFHNSRVREGTPCLVLFMREEGRPAGLVTLEIPAYFQKTGNKRLLEHPCPDWFGTTGLTEVTDFKRSLSAGWVSDRAVDALTARIVDYADGKFEPIEIPQPRGQFGAHHY